MNLFARLLLVAVLPSVAIPAEKIDWGVDVESKPYTFAVDVADINSFDLANMKAVRLDRGKAEETVRLKRGKAKKEYRDKDNVFISETEVTLRWAKPLNAQRRVVYYEWGWYAGSSDQGGIVQVFELNEGKVLIAQQIYLDMHHGGQEVGARLDENSKELVVKSVPWDSPNGRCCPSHLNTNVFHWDGQRFVRIRATRVAFPEMHKPPKSPSTPVLSRSTPKTAP
jgi:hypothetical protein